MTIRSHLVHLFLYSTLVAGFFSVLLRRGLREQRKMFAWTWAAMVGGALVLAYAMFPFPG